MSVATDHSSSVLPSPSLPADTREDLHRYAEAGGFTLRVDTHPWYAAIDSVSRVDEARAASTLLAELRGRDLPLLDQAAERLSGHPGLENTAGVGELAAAVVLLLRVHGTRGVLRPDAFDSAEEELQALVAATASSAWRAERGVRQSWWQRSRLTRRARRLATTPRPDRDELHRALDEAATARATWAARAQDGGRPTLPEEPEFLQQAGQAAEATLTELAQLTALIRPETPLEQLTLAELTALLDRLAADEATLFRLPRLHELRATLSAQGLDDLLAHLTTEQADLPAVQSLTTPPAPRSAPEAEDATPLATEPEASPQAPAEAEAEAEAEAAPEATDALATEPEAAEAPAAAEPEAAPQAQAEAEAAPQADADEPEAAPQAQAEAEAGPQAQAEADSDDAPAAELPALAEEPPAAPQAQAEAGADDAPAAELPTPATEPEAAPQAQAEAEAAPQADADEPETALQAQAEADSDDAPSAELPTPATEPEAAPQAQAEAGTDDAPAPAGKAQGATRRARKPAFTPGRPVTAYAAAELEAVVRWIDGDGTTRSDDELLRATMKELGFSRLGPRIKEALGAAVAAVRG